MRYEAPPPPTSSNQLDAIEVLRILFEKWRLLALPSLLNEGSALCLPCVSPTPTGCSLLNTTPAPDQTNYRFHAIEQNDGNDDAPGITTLLPPPLPALVPRTPVQRAHVTPFQQATPTRLVFDDVASPSVPRGTPQLPVMLPLPRVSKSPSPIALRSPIARQTRSRLEPPQLSSLMELVQYHIPTAKTT